MQAIKLADVHILAIRLEQVREEINLIYDSEGDRIQPDEVECAIAHLLQMQLEDSDMSGRAVDATPSDKIRQVLRSVQRSKVWEDPKKRKRLEKLLLELENLAN